MLNSDKSAVHALLRQTIWDRGNILAQIRNDFVVRSTWQEGDPPLDRSTTEKIHTAPRSSSTEFGAAGGRYTAQGERKFAEKVSL